MPSHDDRTLHRLGQWERGRSSLQFERRVLRHGRLDRPQAIHRGTDDAAGVTGPLTDGEKALDAAEALAPVDPVLDLSGLSFIDSSGLHCIVRAHERAQKEGRRMVLVPGSSSVQRVLELTGMDRHLEFVTRGTLEGLLAPTSDVTVA